MKVVLFVVLILASFSALAQVKPKTDSIGVLPDSLHFVDSLFVPDGLQDWETGMSKPYLAYMPLKPPAGGYVNFYQAYVPKRNSHLPFGYRCSSYNGYSVVDRISTSVYQCDYTSLYRLGFIDFHHTPIHLLHQTYPKMKHAITYYYKAPEIVMDSAIKPMRIIHPVLREHFAFMRSRTEEKYGNRLQVKRN